MPPRVTVRYVKFHEKALLPRFAHGPGEDAGLDLCSVEDVGLPPRGWKVVRTGLGIQLPPGYEGQVRPRSGLACAHGVTLLNCPATIDPGYRGELRITLINFGPEEYRVRAGDRIAQLIVGRYAEVRWEAADALPASRRGAGGFGSTGR